ncbi:MAG: hypothetical protein HY023_03120 [Chloroflexi bacterium]|nr:hypothetical protein [Chloroflexota bacterium]
MDNERDSSGKGAGLPQSGIGRDTNMVLLFGQIVGQVETVTNGNDPSEKIILTLSSNRGAGRPRVECVAEAVEAARKFADGDWVMVMGHLAHFGSGAIGVRAVSIYSLNR